MNYKLHYDALIKKYGLKNKPDFYSERHHIVPKSMGGLDNIANLVYLTPKQHFIAHWLLWKIHRNQSMAHAFWMMSSSRKFVGSFAYNAARKANAEASSIRNKGRIPSNKEWFIENISRKPKSEEFKLNQSKRLLNSHHLAYRIMTPFGEFNSLRQAESSLKIDRRKLSKMIKDPDIKYYYCLPAKSNDLS
jgi:hypothetical protein